MSKGHELFAQYAYPPNELGYCGPSDGAGPSELATHAKDFDGAWPYLTELAKAVGGSDPLDEETVRSYWIGGPSLDEVNADEMLARLRAVFKGQVSGLLSELPTATGVLAHHSFHVFVVYPWVKFLDRDPTTSVGVMQDCRIRWGTVESVAGQHVMITSRPLRLATILGVIGTRRHVGAGVGLREAVRPTVWRLGSVVRDGQCQAMPCGVHVGASQSGPVNDQIL